MSQKTKNKFELGEMFLGFVVGLIIDGIAFLGDLFSFGFLGWIAQSVLWPFVKNYWLKKGGSSVLNDPLKGYLIPIMVQGIPFLPTMCATIVVVMYLENHPEKLGIIEKGAQIAVGAATGGTGSVAMKVATSASRGSKIVGTINKVNKGAPLSNTNKPRILSMPSSPLRTQNNPIIQEHNEEQEKIKHAA
ncbi:hypothetical protein C4565_00960 [Candidatus Parcubacteria bacterium]|jgi:hypothetical protein|nr:MAG: hypothetical protein C4565_00960 [Candidatus Parcubacteria bacterium]